VVVDEVSYGIVDGVGHGATIVHRGDGAVRHCTS